MATKKSSQNGMSLWEELFAIWLLLTMGLFGIDFKVRFLYNAIETTRQGRPINEI
jgi:hypothetical protein